MTQSVEERRAAFGTRLECRRRAVLDFWWFCRWIIGDMGFQGHADQIDTRFHRRMAGFIATEPPGKRLSVVLEPRGHLKSTICTIFHSVWLLVRNPDERILLVHGIEEKALAFMAEIQDHIGGNERLKWIAPDIFYKDPEKEARDWDASTLTVKRRWSDKVPSITASGLTSTQASSHYSRIKGDDLVNEKNCQTIEQLEKATLSFKRQQNLLRNAESRYDFIGTIWHYYDTSGFILDPKNGMAGITRTLIESCWEPGWEAVPEAEREPVWPEVKSRDFLLAQRATMGSHEFAQQMLNQRILEGTMIFSEGDVRRYDRVWGAPVEGKRQPPLILPGTEPGLRPEERRRYLIYTAIDPNTNREGNAYDAAVVLTIAKDDLGNVYVIDLRHGHPSQSEFIGWGRESVAQWEPSRFFVEVVGYQHTLMGLFEQDGVLSGTRYPLDPVERGGDTRKFTRIVGLQPLIERRQLFVPYGSQFDPLMEEIRTYSSKAKIDDCLDALADAVKLGVQPIPARKPIVEAADPWMLRQTVFAHAYRQGAGGVRERARPLR